MTSAAFNREFARLQNSFEHPVKRETALAYFEHLKHFAEPDLIVAVDTLILDERSFPRIATLREALEKAAAARKKDQRHDPEAEDERPCVAGCERGLVWAKRTMEDGQPSVREYLLGRCAVCQRGYPRALPVVDPTTGRRVNA